MPAADVILEIALPVPLHRQFDYLAPSNSPANSIQPGCRVKVLFSGRELTGFIIRQKQTSDFDKLATIKELPDTQPLLDDKLLKLASWISDYYQHPLGGVLDTLIPTDICKTPELEKLLIEKQWQLTEQGKSTDPETLTRAPRQRETLILLQSTKSIETLDIPSQQLRTLAQKHLAEKIELKPKKIEGELLKHPRLELNTEQQQALNAITLGEFQTTLLQGVTGSGKTEVYLQAIEQALEQGKQCLVLIPEIGLSPQTVQRFVTRFNRRVVALHSGMADRERAKNWLLAQQGLADIVIGTRSAVMTPIPNLGLIIVDEEHDLSYKQQDRLRYSARDTAIVRAKHATCPVILGSATPSLESYLNAQNDRYQHLHLRHRASNAQAPTTEIVDLREHPPENGLSAIALKAIADTLNRGEQAMVFINRRGYAPQLRCRQCNWVSLCPCCDQPFTIHKNTRQQHCHHCGYHAPIPQNCDRCQSHQLEYVGQGTERVEESLARQFGDSRLLRIDRDTTQSQANLKVSLDKINSGEPCVVVGTQMIAKGHHFENVTLVIVMDADGGLLSADFRATERLMQLITQVSGRSGRGDKPGRVLIQTREPTHPILSLVKDPQYDNAAKLLLAQRHQGRMPPYTFMALVRAESHDFSAADNHLQNIRRLCETQFACDDTLHFLGPLPALIEKRQNRFRLQLQITSSNRITLKNVLKSIIQHTDLSKKDHRVRWSIDVDPQDMS